MAHKVLLSRPRRTNRLLLVYRARKPPQGVAAFEQNVIASASRYLNFDSPCRSRLYAVRHSRSVL